MINYQSKTKEELIIELQELQQKYNSLEEYHNRIIAQLKGDEVIIKKNEAQMLSELELSFAEEHAEENERLRTEIMASMSHELRTPMTGILGFAELLKEPDLTEEQQQQYISIIEKSGERVLNIINEIADISGTERGTTHVRQSDLSKPEIRLDIEKKDFDDSAVKQVVSEAKGLKILIAEDDETSETLIEIVVKAFGKEILKVRNGVDAVEACRNNMDIDLVLMDIQMPLLNGYEATRQIRQFNKKVIIIAQTAYGLTGDKEKSIEAGCNDYITKPVGKDKLKAVIQKHFI